VRWLAAAWVVAGRELLATVRSPIAWVVGAAFLALEGVTFAATVRLLADPTRPGDYGAVLRGQFAASLLGWLVLFAVVAAVTMRLVAEERRQGTWETLVTAPVPEGAVLAGKWLAAWLFLCALWLPTLCYPAIVAAFSPPGASLDLGPVAAAYLGVALLLAAAAAIGLLASAASSSQVVASVLGFGALVALLLIGELDEVAPGALGADSAPGRLVAWIDLRRRMDDLARGAIDLGAIALFAGLAAIAGAAAHAAAALGRWRAGHGRRRLLVAGLIALDVVLVNLVVARHDHRFDWSAAELNRLDEATRELLVDADRRLVVTVVRPALASFDPVYAEVDALVGRMAAEIDLERRDLDSVTEPDAVAALADAFGAPPRDLADGGAVVLEVDGRRRLVELLDMASFGRDALEVGAIERLAVEQAIAGALAELVRGAPLGVCFSRGHGELALEGGDGADLSRLAAALRADGLRLDTIGDGPVPADCRVVVVAGPEAPLPPDQAIALGRHLERGGGLLVLVRGAGPTGLELVLAGAGLALSEAVVTDPERAVELPGAFGVTVGYADHPVTRPFQGRRMTVWQAPRAVEPAGDGGDERALVRVAAGDGDGRGVVAAARVPASGARVAAVGSASSLAGALADGVPANVELVRRLVAWLGGLEPVVVAPAKTPEHLRLIMTRGQLRLVFGLAVFALPLLSLLVGAAVAWRRRRG
jgi:ABC-2 type transport system permease protein